MKKDRVSIDETEICVAGRKLSVASMYSFPLKSVIAYFYRDMSMLLLSIRLHDDQSEENTAHFPCIVG